MSERIKCGGLIERTGLCIVEVLGFTWRPGASCGILSKFADAEIPLAFLNIGNDTSGNKTMAFCIARDRMKQVPELLDQIRAEFEPDDLKIEQNITIVTLYGPHFYERVALASEVYSCLCLVGVEAFAVGSSVNSISMVLAAKDLETAKRSLAERFEWPV